MGLCPHLLRYGTQQGPRRNPHFLESIRHFQRRRCHWSHSWAHKSSRSARSVICCSFSTHSLPSEVQTHRSGGYRYLRALTWRTRRSCSWQRSDLCGFLFMAHNPAEKGRPNRLKIDRFSIKQRYASTVNKRLDLPEFNKRGTAAEVNLIFRPCDWDKRAHGQEKSWSHARKDQSLRKSKEVRSGNISTQWGLSFIS